MAVPLIIVGSYNLFTLIYKSLYVINVHIQMARSIQYMDAVQSVYDLLQYIVDMWYVFKYGADICREYINRYCYMDGLLGMKYYSDIKSSLVKFLCFIVTLWFITSLYDYLKNVKLFRCYYLLISEQVKFINRMFGMRILLNTLSLLIDMVRLINLTVRVAVGLQVTTVTFYPAIGSLVKVLMCAVLLISIVWRSEKAYEQRSRLMCLIDNLLVNKKIDESIVEDIKDFHSLIQARPISFSMANFVRIDNSFLVSIVSAVVTYSIILLQSVN
ncbi:uncharacterized protein LOC121733322 [Aricia agestis]|uniref:uncharacterized protein LOC121733322 n=1 Tax=Aricia agestis TaxID=91739 RepID=UPI001C209161|nr:uncharacterized protein LOC121733322 [Aricia agestis]